MTFSATFSVCFTSHPQNVKPPIATCSMPIFQNVVIPAVHPSGSCSSRHTFFLFCLVLYFIFLVFTSPAVCVFDLPLFICLYVYLVVQIVSSSSTLISARKVQLNVHEKRISANESFTLQTTTWKGKDLSGTGEIRSSGRVERPSQHTTPVMPIREVMYVNWYRLQSTNKYWPKGRGAIFQKASILRVDYEQHSSTGYFTISVTI